MPKNYLKRIFGEFTWSAPTWMRSVAAQPYQAIAALAILLALILLTIYSINWYQHRPRPAKVVAHIITPKITPVAKDLIPDDLSIRFGTNHGYFIRKSVAPLNLIGKEVKTGIQLDPAMPGKWVWLNGYKLVFTPENDWPAGQTYALHFDKKIFAPGTSLEKQDYSFSTLPFAANVTEFKFYQDPLNSQLRQAVATIQFNYSVDPASFEKQVTLHQQERKDSTLNFNATEYKFTVEYDEHKRTAYLKSEPLPLPKQPEYLILTLNKGIQSASGSSKTTETVTRDVLIPDATSFFKITHVAANIVRNAKDRPEQILSIETSLGVTDAELNKGLHVYLLPVDYPATANEEAKKNYRWQNPGEASPYVLKQSEAVELKQLPSERDYTALHSYTFNAPASRYLFVKFDDDIQGFGGYSLSKEYGFIVPVPAYPKEIAFLHPGSLLSLVSEQKLSVLVRGLPAVKFQFARVLPDEVNHLITQSYGNFNDPKFVCESFNQNNISQIYSEIQTFDASHPEQQQYTALNIGKYLAAKNNISGPQGLFLLKAIGWDQQNNTPLDDVKSAARLVLLTDMGLLVKDNSDGSHDVFVDSISQGLPVSNVEVSVLGKNGLPIISKLSDQAGHVYLPSLKDYIDEREPVAYLAKKANDVSFIPYNNFERELNFSRFDTGGVYSNQETHTLSAYLFSDRGIYRPDDLAHIAMIVKGLHVTPQPAGLPLQISVTDPRGNSILEKKFTLDAIGYSAFDVPTTAVSPTGQYTINLFIVKDNHPSSLLGSTTINVQEFQPDRMRIASSLSAMSTEGWVSPNKLMSLVNLKNLYGAPAANRKITEKIVLIPKVIQFHAFPNYIFFDPLFDPKKPPKVFTDTLAEGSTDNQGQARFDLNLERFEKATYQLTVYSEGFEAEGGRSVSTQTSQLVSPLAYLIGYKSDGDLNYIKQNDARSIHFIAVNPQLKLQSLNNLTLQLAVVRPVSTLVKNADGTYQYQSIMQTQVVSSKPFSIDQQGSKFVLPSQQIGDFLLTVQDEHHTELSKLKFSVVGASQAPLAKNAELSVKLNKTNYMPGEDIELQITAPYTGSGLITIESDKVYASQWFVSRTTNSVQKIHLPTNFEGNGYVNVAYIRDWNSPEIFISPLSYSIVPFAVNHDQHAVHINLTTPDLARPGEPFVIHYQTDKPTKIIVFGADEGILQAANYQVPNPLAFFFQKRALEVITRQTVDQILPKFMQDRELSAVGGDGGEAALRSHLNPFKRKTEQPVAFWSGVMDADTTDRQLSYSIPSYFNGTLHVIAVAVAADAVGAADKESEVRGYFVINPNVPTFVAPGDEFTVTASIANNVKGSGKNANINVQFTASSQLEILSPANQTLTIDEGQEQTVRYRLRAKNQLSSAELHFAAQLDDKRSDMSATLSVRPASAYMTSVMSGHTNKASYQLKLDRDIYPEYRDVEALLSTNPLILAAGLQRYLDNFPFGCTEQLVSKAFPLVAMGTLNGLFGDPQKISEKINSTFQMLGLRQMSNGGFSYWPNVLENRNNDFASIYAMHFLTEAKAAGYQVPLEIFRSGLNYLKDFVQEDTTNLEKARLQAYAIYLLTRNEIVTTNYLTHLQLYLDKDPKQLWHNDLTSAYIAAAYQLLKNNQEAERLIQFYHLHSKPIETTDFYDEKIADAQYLFLIAKHFPNQFVKLGNDEVMSIVDDLNSENINTIFSSYTSLALSAYGQLSTPASAANFSMTEVLADAKKQLLSAYNQFIQAKVNLGTIQLQLDNPNKQLYFYQLTQSGFDKKLSGTPIKNNLEIYREFRDLKGNVLTQAKLGEEIEVHIQIRAMNRANSNVAVTDLLPGGFEVVKDSIKNESLDYFDVREDRVVFFLNVTTEPIEINYRIKATNLGKYIVPPIYAAAMYDPNVNAVGAVGEMRVE